MRRLAFLFALLILFCSSVVGQGVFDNVHYLRGVSLMEARQFRAAGLELQKALEQTPATALSQVTELKYRQAVCEAQSDPEGGDGALEQFIATHPNSIFNNDAHFQRGVLMHTKGNYANAQTEFLSVDPFALAAGERDKYNFAYGHTLFMTNSDEKAYSLLRSVEKSGEYGAHAQYFVSYIDYTKGNYTVAKEGFKSLENNPAYSAVIPFYLFQIEFLQDNHAYVVAHADALAATAVSPRDAEIFRLAAESWFVQKEYFNTLEYMDRFTSRGGAMGREEHYLVGYSAYMLKRYDTAVANLSRAVGAEDQLSQNASYHLADAYMKLGDKRLAMQSFSIAASGEADNSIREDALYNYGKLQYELGGGVFNEAINVLNRYITQYPNSPRVDSAREYLIAAYYNSHDYSAAYQAIKLIPNPDNNVKAAYQKIAYFRALEFFKQGDLAGADQLLAESARSKFNPKYTALTSFWQGEILCARGQYQKAIPLFNSYINNSPRTEPEHATAMYNLGYCYFNAQNWSESAAWFGKYVALHKSGDSFRADAFNRLGDTALADRSFAKAIENYNNSIRINTDQRFYAAYQRALMLGLDGRTDIKIESLKDIIVDGQGGFVDQATYELGRTYISLERFTEGATTLKKFIATYPNSPKAVWAMSDLGLVYQNLDNDAEAIKYYKMAVAKAPTSPQGKEALMALRGIYVDLNDVDSYVSYVEKSGVETNVTIVERDSLSFAGAEKIYVSGDSKRGLTALDGYLKSYPRGAYRSAALYYASDCAMRENNRAGAQTYLTELDGMYYNSFTIRGLDRLAGLQYQNEEFAKAAASYQKLSKIATTPAMISNALLFAMRAQIAMQGSSQEVLEVAKQAMDSPFATVAVVREAKYVTATTLRKEGKTDNAIRIYRELAKDATSVEGAESAYRVIEYLHANGQNAPAKELVFEFSKQNSSHSFWVGKSFLILGDIYAAEGDMFQARATFQSIVDGYSPANDGVVNEAREKIKGLK